MVYALAGGRAPDARPRHGAAWGRAAARAPLLILFLPLLAVALQSPLGSASWSRRLWLFIFAGGALMLDGSTVFVDLANGSCTFGGAMSRVFWARVNAFVSCFTPGSTGLTCSVTLGAGDVGNNASRASVRFTLAHLLLMCAFGARPLLPEAAPRARVPTLASAALPLLLSTLRFTAAQTPPPPSAVAPVYYPYTLTTERRS